MIYIYMHAYMDFSWGEIHSCVLIWISPREKSTCLHKYVHICISPREKFIFVRQFGIYPKENPHCACTDFPKDKFIFVCQFGFLPRRNPHVCHPQYKVIFVVQLTASRVRGLRSPAKDHCSLAHICTTEA